ncbi:MAG: cytochrome c [Acidobacteria bacterium]|nr:cytochrome c [Acidobacteriota bacterium]
MRGSFVVFALAAALASGAAAEEKKSGDAAKGKEVFEEQCSICHDATGTEKKNGPPLKGLFQKAKLASGKKVTEANVKTRINEGGGTMPAFEDLKGADLDNLIAYLKTI